MVYLCTDLKRISLSENLHDRLDSDDCSKVLNMTRLTGGILQKMAGNVLISGRLLGTEVTCKDVNQALNLPLHSSTIRSIGKYFSDSAVEGWESVTLGRLILLSIEIRINSGIDVKVPLNEMLLALGGVSRAILQKDPIEVAICLTSFFSWIQGEGCFDCAMRIIMRQIGEVSILIGSVHRNLEVNDNVWARLHVFMEDGNHARINQSDPMTTSHQDKIARECFGAGLLPIRFEGTHSVWVVGNSYDKIIIVGRGPDGQLSFDVTQHQYAILLSALDMAFLIFKSFRHVDSSVGGIIWCKQHYINPFKMSTDIAKIASELYELANLYKVHETGFMLLGSIVLTKTFPCEKVVELLKREKVLSSEFLIEYLFIRAPEREWELKAFFIRELFYSDKIQYVPPEVKVFSLDLKLDPVEDISYVESAHYYSTLPTNTAYK
uniref:Uncharacterized protein n=1 Tax=Lutzomyia longipalpis TaxID=7200 RepID=A0A1B0C8U3_LUTLO